MRRRLLVRALAEKGVVRDIDPQDLPGNVVSLAFNCRFKDGRIERIQQPRAIRSDIEPTLTGIYGYRSVTGSDRVFMFADNNDIFELGPVPDYDLLPVHGTAPEWPTNGGDSQWTFSTLGDVLYANRPYNAPLVLQPNAVNFTTLPNMDSDWRARVVRTIGDYVVAFGVTKGSVDFPSMVKWSDNTLYGQAPATWDTTVATNNAGENVLAELDSGIVDAAPLGDRMIIYSQRQVIQMTQTGDTFVFRFQTLFSEGGAIAPNCAVEVNGRHYVFGDTDIYVHDGINKQSIAEGRVRRAIFDTLDYETRHHCFVYHNPASSEVHFYYPSRDSQATFQNRQRCNVGAIYNYANDTWSFRDIPNLYGMASASIPTVSATYDSTDLTYDTAETLSYRSFEELKNDVNVGIGRPGATTALWGFDAGSLNTLPIPVDTASSAPMKVERTYIDLDPEGLEITRVKSIVGFVPRMRFKTGGSARFTFGHQMAPNEAVAWDDDVEWDGTSNQTIDVRINARLVAFRLVLLEPTTDVIFSGLDVILGSTGARGR